MQSGILQSLPVLPALALLIGQTAGIGAEPPPPANNRAGQPPPEYITGDECLFCHRIIGQTWSLNEHQKTLLPTVAVPEIETILRSHPDLQPFARQIRFVLGNKHQIHLLKKSEKYGRLDLLSAVLRPNPDGSTPLLANKPPFHWDTKTFGQQCAGCHTTAVDSRTQAFSATAIDCYACHGVVDLKHANDPALISLSKKRNDPPGLIAATCGQCHIRTGTSKASGLPYANNHVVGDNLFADFQVNLSADALAVMPPRERHILANIRNSLKNSQEPLRDREPANKNITCLSCHNIHRASGRKHRKVAQSDYCNICHQPGNKKLTYNRKEKHHTLCGY